MVKGIGPDGDAVGRVVDGGVPGKAISTQDLWK